MNVFSYSSFVSENIETLEEIDMGYKHLALESGIENWSRVPALGCTSSFIMDLADAVIEALPSAIAISAWRSTSKAVDYYPMQQVKCSLVPSWQLSCFCCQKCCWPFGTTSLEGDLKTLWITVHILYAPQLKENECWNKVVEVVWISERKIL